MARIWRSDSTRLYTSRFRVRTNSNRLGSIKIRLDSSLTRTDRPAAAGRPRRPAAGRVEAGEVGGDSPPERVGVKFEYRGFVAASLADLEPYMLDVRPGVEAVAVNSVMELHRLLARPGAAEKVLATVRAVAPDVFTVVEQEAEHNGPTFLERFNEALHYYSTMFDSFEGGGGGGGGEEQVMAEMYVGRQIGNVVASEGAERVERHEKMARWRGRMEAAGFAGVHLGSNAFKQASMLLALFAGGDGYRVEEKDGCLMLGWHTRPLIATSAWRVAAH